MPKERPIVETSLRIITPPAIRTAGRRRRPWAAPLLATSLALVVMLGGLPGPATAAAAAAATSTADGMVATVLGWLNRDRAAMGLVPLRGWTSLNTLASDRAARMATLDTLSHEAAGGNVGTALTSRGIGWYGFGETIGASSYPWGSAAAGNIYNLLHASPIHRSIMFSARFNYIGVGFAYRSESGTTFASMVFTESADHTGASARNVSLTRSGTRVMFAWSGYDPRLQTHTAGLRSFDVQYRVDGGTWRTIRNDTTVKALSLSDRARGHWYGFRVQAADRRGNLGRWTTASRIWVP